MNPTTPTTSNFGPLKNASVSGYNRAASAGAYANSYYPSYSPIASGVTKSPVKYLEAKYNILGN